MEKEDNTAYLSLYVPMSLKDFFREIAISEQRDLAFIIRRALVRVKSEIETKRKNENQTES